MTKIIEFDVDKIVGLDEEEKDSSVNYYVPFCLGFQNEKGEKCQLFLDYDKLIDLAILLKPYLESYEEQTKADEEMHKEWEKVENE